MSIRSFPPTPDEPDELLLDLMPDEEEDEQLEIVVTERGTEWSDSSEPDLPEDDESLLATTLHLPGEERVSRFLVQVDRRTGLSGDVALLSDLDRSGLAAFGLAWPGLPTAGRRGVAAGLAAASGERYDMQFSRVFMELLRDGDAVVRQYAVAGLADEQADGIVERLIRLTEADGSTDVRAAAAGALSGFADLAAAGDEIGIDADELSDVLQTIVVDEDEPILLRRSALETWAVFGSRGADGFSSNVAEAITEMYNGGETASRASALIAMGRTLDRVWLSFVERDLASDDAELRFAAVVSAGQIADAVLVEPVTGLTTDDDDEVRLAAVTALGQIGGPGAIRVLRNLAEDPERSDHDVIDEAIEEATLAAEGV